MIAGVQKNIPNMQGISLHSIVDVVAVKVTLLLVALFLVACGSSDQLDEEPVSESQEETTAAGYGAERSNVFASCDPTTDEQWIDFVHVADLHAHYAVKESHLQDSPYARIKEFQYEILEENPFTLLTDGGDDHEKGSVAELISNGESTKEIVDAMDFDLRVIGNHDFAYGENHLLEFSNDLDHVVLASNTSYTGGSEIGFGASEFSLLRVGCVTIGVFGMVGKPWNEHHRQYNGQFMENFESRFDLSTRATELTKKLREKGAELVVMVSHLGLSLDEDVAQNVNDALEEQGKRGLDVILGGHSHSKLRELRKIGDTRIVHAGSKAQYIGHLRILVNNDSGQIEEDEFELVDNGPGSREPDPVMQAVIAEVMDTYAPEAFHVLGAVSRDMDHIELGDLAARIAKERLAAQAALIRQEVNTPTWEKGMLTQQNILDTFRVNRMPSGTPGINSLFLTTLPADDLFSLYDPLPDGWSFIGPSCIKPGVSYRIAIQKRAALNPEDETPLPLTLTDPQPVMELWELVEEYARERNAEGLFLDSDSSIL